jgi:formate/nitrite transporter FocA (FNT family)
VLAANLIGVWLFAFVLRPTAFDPMVLQTFTDIGYEALKGTATTTFVKGIFAGWLIALMVWLLPAANGSKPAIIIILTYMVGLGSFPHIVAGSSKILYLAVAGHIGYLQAIMEYMLPTLLGNIVGGVSLVAALNHAQVVAGAKKRGQDGPT